MQKQILASLLSADFYNLKADIEMLEEAGIRSLHLDVMDGQFVPNISFGPGLIKTLRPRTNMFFDTHLMVKEPDRLFPMFRDAGCDLLNIQAEAVTHIHRSIQSIKAMGMKAGLVLNPASPTDILEYLMDDLDLILIMSVNPGFGGQSFIEASLKKIRKVRKMIDESGRDIILEVDGGVKITNMKDVLEAGADWLVAGSAIFNAKDPKDMIRQMQELLPTK